MSSNVRVASVSRTAGGVTETTTVETSPTNRTVEVARLVDSCVFLGVLAFG